jgi:hypothetical protein
MSAYFVLLAMSMIRSSCLYLSGIEDNYIVEGREDEDEQMGSEDTISKAMVPIEGMQTFYCPINPKK